jgi:hypothetical protein
MHEHTARLDDVSEKARSFFVVAANEQQHRWTKFTFMNMRRLRPTDSVAKPCKSVLLNISL